MRYLLDTNIIIFVLKTPTGSLATKLAAARTADVVVCSVVEAELYHGALKYTDPLKRRSILDEFFLPYVSLPFDSLCVPPYARIRDHLERQGQIIGGNDLMIASIALANDLTVVTHNSNEFNRVPGLRVEDWV